MPIVLHLEIPRLPWPKRVLGLTKPILKASKGAKMTTLREDFQLPEVDLLWPIFGTLFYVSKLWIFR